MVCPLGVAVITAVLAGVARVAAPTGVMLVRTVPTVTVPGDTVLTGVAPTVTVPGGIVPGDGLPTGAVPAGALARPDGAVLGGAFVTGAIGAIGAMTGAFTGGWGA